MRAASSLRSSLHSRMKAVSHERGERGGLPELTSDITRQLHAGERGLSALRQAPPRESGRSFLAHPPLPFSPFFNGSRTQPAEVSRDPGRPNDPSTPARPQHERE